MKIYKLNYDKLVTNPDEQIKLLVNWLGWKWENAYLKPHKNQRSVTTASNVQIRSPINSKSIGGWRNYKNILEPAIEILIKGLAKEEGRYGVRANAVGPGMLMDGMAATLIDRGEYTQHDLDTATANIPLGYYGNAIDIAEAVCFLASPKARYISGQILNVDGGYTA